ncbi:tetratricopeptide repeat protein [Geminicoccus roseus]|uniref:tetratricopeptide repeat protein n=1 Tax=Geminicoccus roseus TaxID=404900 RepID=UPI00041FB5E9|nr:tetratricopeptide repeat protein [Geminicoccus roseus]
MHRSRSIIRLFGASLLLSSAAFVLGSPGVDAAPQAWQPLPGLSGGLCLGGPVRQDAAGGAAMALPSFRTEAFKPGYGLLQAATEAAQIPAAGSALLEPEFGNSTIELPSDSAEAQRWFDQGLRLSWGFDHGDAILAFQAAQKADPTCALCYWGEAFAWGPNINAPMPPEAVAPAFAALAQAKLLADRAGELERGLIEALTTRYGADPAADRAPLDMAYADAMAELAQRFPDNDEVQVLYADALMNLQPWDYWEADKATPKGRTADQVAALERVLARNPTHVAAIHLYIHTVEASTDPERAEPYADRLAALAPEAGHLVHMPAHIYYRIGRYLDSLETNKAAVGVDEALFAKAPSEGMYRYVYYPHNVHFVLVSAARAGDGPTALSASQKLTGVLSDELARQFGVVQAIKQAPYFAHADFGEPDQVLALPRPSGDLPWVDASWHFARGAAAVRKGDLDRARQEVQALVGIGQSEDLSAIEEQRVPAGDVLAIARLVLEGRIARAEGRPEDAVSLFEQAAALQDGLPYMEPPYWYYPVRQSLGAALLEAGRPKEAIDMLETALEDAPNNAYALEALAQAYRATGDQAAADQARERFQAAWAGAEPPDLRRI